MELRKYFLKPPAAVLDPGQLPSDAETALTPEQQLFAFVEDRQASLETSAGCWQKMQSSVRNLRTVEITNSLADGVDEYVENLGGSIPATERDRIARHLTTDLSTLCFLIPRALNGTNTFIFGPTAIRLLVSQLPAEAHYSLLRSGSPKRVYAESMVDIHKQSIDAEKISQHTLQDIVGLFETSPDSVTILLDLYDSQVDIVNPAFFELRKILSADWRQKDAGNSRLRQWIEHLKSSTDGFVPGFIDSVLTSDTERMYMQVRSMARFALAASGQDLGEGGIRGILSQTRNLWPDFEDINGLFEQYVSKQLALLERAFDSIATSTSAIDFRLAKTMDDIQDFKKRLLTEGPVGPVQRKRHRSANRAAPAAAKPKLELEIEDSARFDRENKPILFAKRVSGNGHITEAVDEAKSLIEFVKDLVPREYIDDMVRCIEKINENPFTRASKVMEGVAVKIAGKPTRLRRFRPNHQPDLKLSVDNSKTHRIAYGIVNGSVVIVDILDHTQFDQKYSV